MGDINLTMTEKVRQNTLREEARVKALVTDCPYLLCLQKRRFIKGMGVFYKRKEYCTQYCVNRRIQDDLVEKGGVVQ